MILVDLTYNLARSHYRHPCQPKLSTARLTLLIFVRNWNPVAIKMIIKTVTLLIIAEIDISVFLRYFCIFIDISVFS